MNQQTRDILVGIALALNIALAAALLYDYVAADSRYTLAMLVAYFAYTTVLLFIWALSRRQDAQQRVLQDLVLEGRLAPSWPAPAGPAGPAAPPRPADPAGPASPEAPSAAPEPFRHGGYTLYARQAALKDGRRRTIHFFSLEPPPDGTPARLPAGYQVETDPRTGAPSLRRKVPAPAAEAAPRHGKAKAARPPEVS
jgi:hypothetical protein